MSIVYLGLGSNLANPLAQLSTAARFLQTLTLSQHYQISAIYRSKPVGPSDQPDFYNAVCQLSTPLAPLELLYQLQQQEQRQHRIKTRHWGERTIDLDILWYEAVHLTTPRLTLPHPELTNRLFVLMPFAELAPKLLLTPQQTVAQALQKLLTADAEGVTACQLYQSVL